MDKKRTIVSNIFQILEIKYKVKETELDRIYIRVLDFFYECNKVRDLNNLFKNYFEEKDFLGDISFDGLFLKNHGDSIKKDFITAKKVVKTYYRAIAQKMIRYIFNQILKEEIEFLNLNPNKFLFLQVEKLNEKDFVLVKKIKEIYRSKKKKNQVEVDLFQNKVSTPNSQINFILEKIKLI